MHFSFNLRGIVFSALFAALLVVFSMVTINLGFSPVPITLQSMAVLLAGALLGARYGFFSMALVVVLTALGLPLLHGNGGLAYLLGPTGGFVFGFPFAALFVGFIVPRIKGNRAFVFVMTFLALEAGSLLLHVIGVPWLAHVARYSLQKAMIQGSYPFLLGDTIKALAATFIVLTVRRAFPIQRLVGDSRSA